MSRVIDILAFVAILTFLQSRGTAAHGHESIFLVQEPTDNKLVVIITWQDEQSGAYRCRISSNPEDVEKEKKKTGDDKILHPSVDEMEKAKEECDTSLKRQRRGAEDQDAADALSEGPTDEQKSNGWNIIFPGTKWCGAGDVAKDDDDLGFHEDTDRCCRAHDKCDDIMIAGETKNNLTNKSPFTALSCKCDHDFYECLSRINSLTSNTVGNSYFNLLRRPCYEEDYPFSNKCKKYRTILKITCLEYERDTSKPKVYQWVKAKFYKQLPFPGPWDITLPFKSD